MVRERKQVEDHAPGEIIRSAMAEFIASLETGIWACYHQAGQPYGENGSGRDRWWSEEMARLDAQDRRVLRSVDPNG
jgi:hypothetical protein